MKISGFNNAVILLDKPEGMTSFSLVSAVKRITGIKKVGHSGTLDKFATGLMVVCTGKATRLTRFFLEDSKKYRGRIRLGIETDTCDITGEIVSRKPLSDVDWGRVEETLSRFKGRMNQLPPKYSALKIGGKRASDRTRAGEDVELAAREIEIFSIDVTSVTPSQGEIEFDVFCSKGTYVRSIARDLGEMLGTGACLSSLRRISSGIFNVSDAATVDELREFSEKSELAEKSFLLNPADVLKRFGRVVLGSRGASRVANGAAFERDDVLRLDKGETDLFIIADATENLIAIAAIDTDKWLIDYNCVFN